MKRVLPLLLTAFIFISCATSNRLVSPVKTKNPEYTQTVRVSEGLLKGVYNPQKTVEIFAGVPYAAPPVGELRWKEPQDREPWDGVYVADTFGPQAMQIEYTRFVNFFFDLYCHKKQDRSYKMKMDEDCLYLNIWKPADIKEGDKVPVLMYIHGGALLNGQSSQEEFDGAHLAEQGVIVVTIAYRLGVFGFFAREELMEESPNGTTGNYGLLDQIKALEWIHSNIESFGGDADNITIAGQSAGSTSVNCICCSPLAKGLFRRAIGGSSAVTQKTPPHTFRTMQKALEEGQMAMDRMNCTTIEQMRQIPQEELIDKVRWNDAMTVDGYALQKTPYEVYQAGENNEEALLNGFTIEEFTPLHRLQNYPKKEIPSLMEELFKEKAPLVIQEQGAKTVRELRELYYKSFTAVCFSYPHEYWSNTVADSGEPVYEYIFTKKNKGIGSLHTGELIYFFRNVPKGYKKSDYELEDIMSGYWLNFMKTGNPNGLDINGKELPLWKTKLQGNGLILELGDECKMRDDPFRYLYGYID